MLAKITVEAVVEVSEEAFAALNEMSNNDLREKLEIAGIGDINIEKYHDQSATADDEWDNEYCDVKKDVDNDDEGE